MGLGSHGKAETVAAVGSPLAFIVDTVGRETGSVAVGYGADKVMPVP